ncbi:MAG: PorP/SprF family type IX secretion system membrane protein [Mucilaginibacter sp.]
MKTIKNIIYDRHCKVLRIGILIAVLTLWIYVCNAQQSFSNTQYMSNLTPYNPAYSLMNREGTADMMIRKQWQGIPGAPTTFMFDGSMPISSINGSSTGILIRNDNFAVEKLTEANVYFAKSLQLSGNHYLGVSINAGLRWYKATYSSLDPNDPVLQTDINQTRANFGFGLVYYSDTYYMGLSVPELTIRSLGNASVQENNDLRNHYYFAGAFVAKLADDIDLKPATLVSYSRGVPVIADISATAILKNKLGLGVNLRTNSEIGGIISITFKSFRFGYSYQFGTSSNTLIGINNATNEITMKYRFGNGVLKPLLF